MKSPVLSLVCSVGVMLAPVAAFAAQAKVTRSEDRVRVELDGQLFTEYIFKGATKPYLYPVLGSDGTQLNRDFPMKKVEGEETDHPHHRSISFTHGDVNGFDFWAEQGGPKQGKIVSDSVKASTKNGMAIIESQNSWIGGDGSVCCTDETTIRLHATAEARMIDFEVKIKAPADKPVEFRDTKEGSISMRVAQWMTPAHRKFEGKGTIINAEGVTNTPTWGKRSNWVDYYAPKDGKVYGVAMFDHPQNPRHPTYWHVRDYGLFAANPFGVHDFENMKDKPHAGDFKIEAGQSVTFRWRFYFHMGDEKAAKIAEHYGEYAAGK